MPKIKFSRIWKISFPILIGNIAQNVLSLTDTAFVGRLDQASIGAAALAGVAYLAIMMFGTGFGIGVQIIIARRKGENRLEDIGSEMQHGLRIILPMAFLLFPLAKFCVPPILEALIESEEVFHATINFLDVRLFGILFGFLVILAQSFFIGIAKTKIITVATILMVVINIIFDYLLVFGNFGCPKLGLAGAAWASIIAEFSAVILYLVYLKRKEFKIYKIFAFAKFSFKKIQNLIRISIPAALQNFLSIGSWFIFFAMVERLGQLELAVSNIARSMYSIFLLPMWGFASAINSLVSYSIGCKKSGLLFVILRQTLILSTISVILIEIFCIIFSSNVAGIYTDKIEIINQTIDIMPSVCISALICNFGFICFNAVSGTGKTQITLFIEILATILYIFVSISSVYLWNWDIKLIWLIDGIYGAIICIPALLYLRFGNWNKASI